MTKAAQTPVNSAQAMFDTSARHLLTQREQSVISRTSSCAYRCVVAGKKLMCAIGPLIPEAAYIPAMEGLPVKRSVVYGAIPEGFRNVTLLTDLQALHDGEDVDNWPKALVRLAAAHRLCPDIVVEMAPEGGQWEPL